MRVLFWSDRFWPAVGGIGTSARRLLRALRARGHKIVVVTLKEYSDLPEKDEYEGIPVYRFPFWTAIAKGDVKGMVELRRRVVDLKKSFRPDLIHINFLGPSVLFYMQTLDAQPPPLVVSLHSEFPSQWVGRESLGGRILRAADWVTCVSAASLAQVRKLVPEITPRSSFIYLGQEVLRLF